MKFLYQGTDWSEDSDKMDLTPEIRYDNNGRPIQVTTYCNVNNWTRAESSYFRMSDGRFAEKHFDEHHGVMDTEPVPCSRGRLVKLRGELPILAILEAEDRGDVERLVGRKKVRHIPYGVEGTRLNWRGSHHNPI